MCEAGQLIDAVLVRGSERRVIAHGEEAVLQMLQWQDAVFTFRHTIAVDQRPVRITHGSEWLVLESIRRRSDLFQVQPGEEITAESRIELTAAPLSAAVELGLDADQWRILSHIPHQPECARYQRAQRHPDRSCHPSAAHV